MARTRKAALLNVTVNFGSRPASRATRKTTNRPAQRAGTPRKPIPPADPRDATATAKAIAAHLKQRTGRAWSVTPSRAKATAGAIRITAPASRRCTRGLSYADESQLKALFGSAVTADGLTIPADLPARAEALRAAGHRPARLATVLAALIAPTRR